MTILRSNKQETGEEGVVPSAASNEKSITTTTTTGGGDDESGGGDTNTVVGNENVEDGTPPITINWENANAAVAEAAGKILLTLSLPDVRILNFDHPPIIIVDWCKLRTMALFPAIVVFILIPSRIPRDLSVPWLISFLLVASFCMTVGVWVLPEHKSEFYDQVLVWLYFCRTATTVIALLLLFARSWSKFKAEEYPKNVSSSFPSSSLHDTKNNTAVLGQFTETGVNDNDNDNDKNIKERIRIFLNLRSFLACCRHTVTEVFVILSVILTVTTLRTVLDNLPKPLLFDFVVTPLAIWLCLAAITRNYFVLLLARRGQEQHYRPLYLIPLRRRDDPVNLKENPPWTPFGTVFLHWTSVTFLLGSISDLFSVHHTTWYSPFLLFSAVWIGSVISVRCSCRAVQDSACPTQ